MLFSVHYWYISLVLKLGQFAETGRNWLDIVNNCVYYARRIHGFYCFTRRISKILWSHYLWAFGRWLDIMKIGVRLVGFDDTTCCKKGMVFSVHYWQTYLVLILGQFAMPRPVEIGSILKTVVFFTPGGSMDFTAILDGFQKSLGALNKTLLSKCTLFGINNL